MDLARTLEEWRKIQERLDGDVAALLESREDDGESPAEPPIIEERIAWGRGRPDLPKFRGEEFGPLHQQIWGLVLDHWTAISASIAAQRGGRYHARAAWSLMTEYEAGEVVEHGRQLEAISYEVLEEHLRDNAEHVKFEESATGSGATSRKADVSSAIPWGQAVEWLEDNGFLDDLPTWKGWP